MSYLAEIIRRLIIVVSTSLTLTAPSEPLEREGPPPSSTPVATHRTLNESPMAGSEEGPHDTMGFKPNGKHYLTNSFFGPDGFDQQGYDRQFYDRSGFHRFTGRNRQCEWRGQVIASSRAETSTEELKTAVIELLGAKLKIRASGKKYCFFLIQGQNRPPAEEIFDDTTLGTCQICQEPLRDSDASCEQENCHHGVHRGACLIQLVRFHLNHIGNTRPITCDESDRGHELCISRTDVEEALQNGDFEPTDQPLLEKLVDRWERATLEAYFSHLGGRFKGDPITPPSRLATEEDLSLIQLLNDPKSDIRRCPYCRVPTQRSEACFHMKCQICKSEWNWKYGRLALKSDTDNTISNVTTFPSRSGNEEIRQDQDARVYRTLGDPDYVPGCDLECGYRRPSPSGDFVGHYQGPIVRQFRNFPQGSPQLEANYDSMQNDGYLTESASQL